MPKKSIPLILAIFLTLTFSSCNCIYFNTFHNIRKNFNTAEKTRQKANRDKARGGEIKKYSDAITKASRILERHPTSSWIDDALYIIGASYYYMGEFDKSARKFKELFANYPESEYIDRSRILLAKAKLQLKEETEAIFLFEEIFAAGKNKEMKAEAARSLGHYYFENKEFEQADVYFRSLIDSLGDENDRLRAYIFIGDGNFDQFLFHPAFDSYEEALDESPDTLQYYHLQYRMAECEYFLGKLTSGLDRIQKLADDDLYYDSLAVLRLKIAEGYEWDGDMDAAIYTYEKITTEAEGKNEAAIAYYELGLIYQYDLEDYRKALEHYSKARGVRRKSPIYEDATKRSSKLSLLEQYNRETRTSDAADTTVALTPDEIDLMGESQYLLGELFYFDLDKPDSAAQAYELLLEKYPHSRHAPQTLISLSHVYRHDYYDSSASDSLLRLVLTDYAHYDEAEAVINMLGLAGTVADSGYAAITFEKGESFLEQILASDEQWHYASPNDALIEDSIARAKEAADSLGKIDGSIFQELDSLAHDSLKQPDDSLPLASLDSLGNPFGDSTKLSAPPRRLSDLMSELRQREGLNSGEKQPDSGQDKTSEAIDSLLKIQVKQDSSTAEPDSALNQTVTNSANDKITKFLIERDKRPEPKADTLSDSITPDLPDSLINNDMASDTLSDSLSLVAKTDSRPDSLINNDVASDTLSDSLSLVAKTDSRPDSGMVIDTTVTGASPDSLLEQGLKPVQGADDSLTTLVPDTTISADSTGAGGTIDTMLTSTVADSTESAGLREGAIQGEKFDPRADEPSDSGMVIDTTLTGPLPDSLVEQGLKPVQGVDDSLATTVPDTTVAAESSATADSTGVGGTIDTMLTSTVADSTEEAWLREGANRGGKFDPRADEPTDSGMVIDTTLTGPLPDSLVEQGLKQIQGDGDSLTTTVPDSTTSVESSATADSTETGDSVAVIIEEVKLPTMVILDSLWNNVINLSRGEGHDDALNLLDSTKYYLRYIVDSFPHSRYNAQAQYVLLWTYDNFLATGDSILYDLYAEYVDSFPTTEYADLIATKYKIRPRKAPPKPKKQIDDEADDAAPEETASDSTQADDQSIDTTSSVPSAISAFITDADGKQLPPAQEYFLLFELKFEYPIEALSYNVEGLFYFHIRINFDGQVEEYRMINPSQSDELNEHLEKVILQTRFDNGKMPPELYDHWFYFPYEVRIPAYLRQ